MELNSKDCRAIKDISVGIVSLGCAKNQVDAEIMVGILSEKGYRIVNEPDCADYIIVNTCGFIEDAKQEAIDSILEMSEYKLHGKCKGIVVTGCLAERYFNEIQETLPEADAVIGICGYEKIAGVIEELEAGRKSFIRPDNESLDYLDLARVPFTPKGSAYLKIAEGCDNKCAYCAIPGIRREFRSRTKESIVEEAKRLAAAGVRELVVVAQDTTRYGTDIYGKPSLARLIPELEKIREIKWIRIMYLYPDEVTEELIDVIVRSKKVVHYVDLPIQHISDKILKSMNRRGTSEDIRRIFKEFKEKLPDVMIRTSLMVGFPGEENADFEELVRFTREIKFDRMGIFKYSNEDNTVAADMPHQVAEDVAEARYCALMELQQGISLMNNRQRVGRIYDTLVEGVADDGIFYIGRTYAEGPEVDGRIYFTSEEPLEVGEFIPVRILIAEEYDLTGEAVFTERT